MAVRTHLPGPDAFSPFRAGAAEPILCEAAEYGQLPRCGVGGVAGFEPFAKSNSRTGAGCVEPAASESDHGTADGISHLPVFDTTVENERAAGGNNAARGPVDGKEFLQHG